MGTILDNSEKLQMKIAKNIMLSLVIPVTACFVFSIVTVLLHYVWGVNQTPSFVSNPILFLISFLTSVCSIFYSIWFLYSKNFFQKFKLLKSAAVIFLVVTVLNILIIVFEIGDFKELAKRSCDVINSASRSNFDFDCLFYFSLWILTSNLILWLQAIFIIEIFEKIGLLNRSTKK